MGRYDPERTPPRERNRVACANQTNHNESETTSINPLSRTMVISYYGTLFGQGAEAFGGISAPAVGGAAGTGISFLP